MYMTHLRLTFYLRVIYTYSDESGGRVYRYAMCCRNCIVVDKSSQFDACAMYCQTRHIKGSQLCQS